MRRKFMLKPTGTTKSRVTMCMLILLQLLVLCEANANGITTRVEGHWGRVFTIDRFRVCVKNEDLTP